MSDGTPRQQEHAPAGSGFRVPKSSRDISVTSGPSLPTVPSFPDGTGGWGLPRPAGTDGWDGYRDLSNRGLAQFAGNTIFSPSSPWPKLSPMSLLVTKSIRDIKASAQAVCRISSGLALTGPPKIFSRVASTM